MNYHMIRTDDMLNGSGLRVVIFTSGCNHNCKGCHNPETWDENSGKEFDNKALQTILMELDKDYISGVTISGGDPLYHNNVKDVFELISCIKRHYPNKTVWVYTGMTWEQIFKKSEICCSNDESKLVSTIRKEIVMMCDVLVDGMFIEYLSDVNCPWVGSTNQRVINVQESIANKEIVLYNN